MTDDLNRLKAALRTATPAPDEDAKAVAIALAQKNFTVRQELTDGARPTHDGSEKPTGFVTGVKNMFSSIGLKPALYASSSLAVLGLGIILVLPVSTLDRTVTLGDLTVVQTETRELAKPEKEEDAAPMVEEAEIALGTRSIEASAPTPTARLQKLQEPVAGFISEDYDDRFLVPENNERFANESPNPLKITAEEAVSTFSIDVDTAAYAFVRATIMDGYLPNPDAVRIEEMVNYFPYDYPVPKAGDAPFATSVSVFQTPWNPHTKLVHIGIQGEKPAVEERPPLDLVFLIDTSGSMQDSNKLPLLKQSFRLLLSRLNPEDRVSMVTYAGSSGVVLESTAANEESTIIAAFDRLHAGGSTAGQAGLQLAYAQAEKMHEDGRIGRVLLATDGDFNVGISNPDDLKQYVEKKRDSGTYLSVLGFGRGNYNDALMQSLAQNGNGTASYIDTLSEAQKVLVDQVSGALFPIANDVKIQVEFNPATVAEYRLIGYETRALKREDFNNDKVDAGDIGAGHTVTAIYEVTPVGSPAVMSDPLRYQASSIETPSNELAFLKLRYKEPGQDSSQMITTPIGNETSTPTNEARFSAAIAGFGQLLRDGKYLDGWGYREAIALANSSKGEDAYGYRAETITLMRLADTLSR